VTTSFDHARRPPEPGDAVKEVLPHKPALWGEGPSGGVVGLPVEAVVPRHLLDGGEIVHFAIKPSPWFVLLTSARWLLIGILLALAAGTDVIPSPYRWYVYQAAFWVPAARVAWAMLDWVSRLYVLTNRRVMRIRGVFNVDLFECSLDRIQNTAVSLPLAERVLRVGSITFQTAAAAGGGTASWRIVARPLEIHEQLRQAIQRAKNRDPHGL
jgi:hypothetical protein